jgi:hypothetical protein
LKRVLRLAFVVATAGASLVSAGTPEPPPLQPGETLTGRFVQERHLAGLAAPLRSAGDFVLAAGKGLVWHSEQPFDTTVVITRTGLLQLVDKQEVQRLPAARAPFLSRLYDMLSGALAGDWRALARDFTVERGQSAAGWTVLLKPAQGDAANPAPLQSITITGAAFVDAVDIHRPNGDWDHVIFSDERRSSDPPPPDAARLLDMAGP